MSSTHTAKASTLGRIAALGYNLTRRPARRCVVIHTFHGHVFSGYFGPFTSAAVRLVERCMAQVTDRVVAISTSQKHDLCYRYRIVAPSKVEILELGIELGQLLELDAETRLREELGFAPNDVVFGYVGRFVPIKDLPTLIRAFGRAADQVSGARLMLVGDGEMRGRLEAQVGGLNLQDRVRFTGWRSDLAEVYGAIDVGVLSSLNEGTPAALIEAMAAGKPVVATAVGGVEDVVTHGRTGLVVPPGDTERLASAMVQLATDTATRHKLGRAARGEIGVRFSPRRLVSEMSQLYDRVLTERRGLVPPNT